MDAKRIVGCHCHPLIRSAEGPALSPVEGPKGHPLLYPTPPGCRPPRYQVAEMPDLQTVRDAARRRRG